VRSFEPMVAVISSALFFMVSIYWLIRRRIYLKRRRTRGKYSKTQIFGIVGILLFLIPIFVIVLSNLVRGIMVLMLLAFSFLQLPNQFISVAISILIPGLYSLLFIGLYLIGEFVWPKKELKT
jgi:hypothetical protein